MLDNYFYHHMISYNEVRKGMFIVFEDTLYEVLESSFLRMQQRKPVMKVKLRDVVAQKVKELSFQPSDDIEEADLERMQARFLYHRKGEWWFDEVGNPQNRFFLSDEKVGEKGLYLVENTQILSVWFEGEVVGIQLPPKVDLEVVDAPPSIKGDTASGGSKTVEVSTGARVNTPFFINTGDVIRVNAETGEYVERIEKGSL